MDTEVRSSSARRKAKKNSPTQAPAERSLLGRLVQRALEAIVPAAPTVRTAPLVEALEPRVLLSGDTVVPRVDGRIDVPGEVDKYSFSLKNDVRIVFDSLTPDSQLQWSLAGPNGTVVPPTSLRSADGVDLSGNTALDLKAGDYTLSVDGVADKTGDYSFRLVDLSKAQSLTPGTTVTGQLSPASETDAYSFTANAGERYFLDSRLSQGDTWWRLITPDGKNAWGPTSAGGDIDTFTTTQTGTYTLLVEGRVTATATSASYAFNLQPVVDPQRTLTIGQPQRLPTDWVAGTLGGGLRVNASRWIEATSTPTLDSTRTVTIEAWINVAQFTNSYMPVVYKGADDASLGAGRTYALFVTNGGDLLLSTGDATGEQYVQTSGGPIKLGQATHVAASIDRDTGVMRIYVDGTLVASGAVRTNLSARSSVKPLFIGHTNEPYGGFGPLVGGVDEVRVWNLVRSAAEIAAARSSVLNGSETGLALYYKLDDGAGNTAADSSPNGNIGRIVNRLDALPDAVEGRIATPGQQVVYTLDVTQTRTVVFDSLSDINFSWSLAGPRGSLVTGRSFQGSDSQDFGGFNGYSGDPARGDRAVYTLAPGRYTLTVDAPGDAIGDFAFRLIDLAAATAITPGAVVSGLLAPGNATQAYRFTVAAGDRFYFDQLSATNPDMLWRLVSPTGEQLWSSYFGSDVAERTYLQAGVYTLLVEGRRYNNAQNAFSFNVLPKGNTLSQRSTGFNQEFDGPALDPLWLVGPNGNPGLDNPVPYTFETLDGASVLRLKGNMPYTGRAAGFTQATNVVAQGLSYEVRFNTLVQSAATGVDELIGLNVVDVDDPGRYAYIDLFSDSNGGGRVIRTGSGGISGGAFSTQQGYAFTDNTWYRIKFEAAADGNLRAVLLSDNGVELFSRDLGFTTDAFAKGARFGIFQNNTTGGTTPRDVAIDWARLTTTPAAPQPLVLGQLVNGNRAVPTQRDLYTFTVAQDTQVVMDTRNDIGALRWTITDARGVIGSLNFQQRSWDWGSNPVMALKAGTYTLQIDGNTTGAYGFRLLDLASATVFAPGASQSGSLVPGNATALYAFDATAGDKLYFDAQSVANGDATWRLISPSGDQRWITGLGSDVDVSTLDQTGRWVLVIEGRRYQAASTNAYTFNVQPVAATTTDITLGQQVGVGPRWVAGAPALGAGSALAFDAMREVTVPSTAVTNQRNDVTIEAWIRPDRYPNTWTPIAVKGDARGVITYGLWVNNAGYLYLGTNDASGRQGAQTAVGSIQLGRWAHVAGVIDRSGATPQLRIYIDGVLAATSALRNTPAADVPEPLRIGNSAEQGTSQVDRFDGVIDEVRLWSVARSGAQIAADRNTP
ncbi:MAG: LEPR-XLL domain-containing protein, partial [Burkholderiaceae bacterium]|nr:LEPR-XLL domain-containing protein [Burkholderiaceae bacterium]